MRSPQQIRIGRGVERHQGTCAWSELDGRWRVDVSGPFGSVSAVGFDAFEALTQVRDQIEPAGWRLGIAGARRNVWPSGMARDMGSGLVAYALDEARAPTKDDLVDVFGLAELTDVTDVADQRFFTGSILAGQR